MKNGERIFYFVLVCLLAGFVVFLQIRMRQTKKAVHQTAKGKTETNRLYSFNGTANSGSEKFFHFTAYSGEYYVFAVISNECGHCKPFVENLQKDIDSHRLEDQLGVYFLSGDTISGEGRGDKWDERFFRLKREDILQFGSNIPLLVLTNGQGKVLFRSKGYMDNAAAMMLDIYRKHRYRKSEKL